MLTTLQPPEAHALPPSSRLSTCQVDILRFILYLDLKSRHTEREGPEGKEDCVVSEERSLCFFFGHGDELLQESVVV